MDVNDAVDVTEAVEFLDKVFVGVYVGINGTFDNDEVLVELALAPLLKVAVIDDVKDTVCAAVNEAVAVEVGDAPRE